MPFWKCYYHVIWATKNRQPIISPALEQVLFATIEEKSVELGSSLLAINAVADHVHVAVSIPPAISVAKWVGGAKGAASRAMNTGFELDDLFRWQEGYGVLSYGEKRLAQVKQYIASQKERHQMNDLNDYLERIDD